MTLEYLTFALDDGSHDRSESGVICASIIDTVMFHTENMSDFMGDDERGRETLFTVDCVGVALAHSCHWCIT